MANQNKKVANKSKATAQKSKTAQKSNLPASYYYPKQKGQKKGDLPVW